MTMFDILGIGCATVDEFLRVDVFPTPDTKQEVLGEDRQGGGLIPTALVAATRLGRHCAYFDMLGTDDLSRWVIDDLAREGLDVSPILIRPNARPIHAVIIVTLDGSRTILYNTTGRVMTDGDVLPDDAIRNARLLMLDDVNGGALDGLARAAAGARRAGIPVVADFERPAYRPLLDEIDHLIVSAHWASAATGLDSPQEAVKALWTARRAAVVVTCGSDGAWSMDAHTPPTHHPAYSVSVVDTTGCGDVFHGAYAVGVLEGLPLRERIRLAAATAALKATQLGGRPGTPTRAQVNEFLRARGEA
jgi:sugar/nucleoside kinase (ribokinase family)